MNIKLLAKTAGVSIKKHAPEILTFVGISSIAAGTVVACVNTHKKLDKAITKNTVVWTNLNDVKDHKDEYADYSEKEYRKDVIKAAGNTALDILKVYGVPLALIGAGVGCMLTANGILKKRWLVSAATAEATLASFNKYRENVRKKLGEGADKEFLYGFEKVIQQTVDKETGEVKEEEVVVATNSSPFMKLFSEDNCPLAWFKGAGYNQSFLKTMQAQMNDRLKRENYLYLKDVLQALGFAQPTLIINGQDVSTTYGWVHCMERQDYVDFGLFNFEGKTKKEIERLVAFNMDEEPNVWLEFNVSGDISKLVPELMYREAVRKHVAPWEDTPVNY